SADHLLLHFSSLLQQRSRKGMAMYLQDMCAQPPSLSFHKLKGVCESTVTISDQLNEVHMDYDDALHGKLSQNRQTGDETETTIRGYRTGLNRVKRRKFRGMRRTQTYMKDGEEEYDDQNVTWAPRNGCVIPLNWSRIHHRGKSFLGIAGRSLSCGFSESKLKRGGLFPQGRDVSNVSDNLLRREIDSDLLSEARSEYFQTTSPQNNFRRQHNSKHQNLTQKYMPRTFRDLVAQNLVKQALSNAVVRRKVGKSSYARIFARALICQSLDQPKPCRYCNACIAYDIGKSRNIREVG
ncbi:Protein STICHEL-like 3, partial [Camellia lanceoleosa]